MKRILLDQGLAPRAAALLRAEGWEAIHVSEIGMERADDSEILEFARRDKRACVTLDHDFHARLALGQAVQPSVVLIRIPGVAAEDQAILIRRVCETCSEALITGSAVTVDGKAVRIRKLPLR